MIIKWAQEGKWNRTLARKKGYPWSAFGPTFFVLLNVPSSYNTNSIFDLFSPNQKREHKAGKMQYTYSWKWEADDSNLNLTIVLNTLRGKVSLKFLLGMCCTLAHLQWKISMALRLKLLEWEWHVSGACCSLSSQ